MLTIEINTAVRPDPTVDPIPAVLDAAAIGRILGVSRPVAYSILHACRPIRVGRLTRVLGEDFRAWLEAQR